MLEAMLALSALGLVFGGLLAFAAKKLEVDTDPKVDDIRESLPGANCGACGYAGCTQFAEGVARGEAPVAGCIPGGVDVSDRVAEIMGAEKVAAGKKKVASLGCAGDCNVTRYKFDYDGVQDCRYASLHDGGPKECSFGCLGLGTCVDSCPFDAITMGKHGIAEIDLKRCTGCGKCESSCPKNIIKIIDADTPRKVRCISTEKGKKVKDACDVGCIGCGICVKKCPEDAIVMEDNLAWIDASKCTDCGICVEKCPRNSIA